MMGRPLLITDCDEVLLHMVRHFAAWLDEAHAIDFATDRADFGGALTRRSDRHVLSGEEVWPLLDGFFDREMARQTLVPGALAALERIARVADVVVLTNLRDVCHPGRVAQLEAIGLRHRVVCNQGPKGPAVARILDELKPSGAVFVDDIPGHHESVAAHAPDVWRLHLVAEPWLAELLPPAAAAHARIDEWHKAVGWVMRRLTDRPAVAA